MSKGKPILGGRAKKKTAISLVRSSAAQDLTFMAASGQGGEAGSVIRNFRITAADGNSGQMEHRSQEVIQ